MSETLEERIEYPTFSKFWMMCGGGIHGAWKHRRYKDIREMAEKLPKMAWDAQQQKIAKLERDNKVLKEALEKLGTRAGTCYEWFPVHQVESITRQALSKIRGEK